MTRFCARCRQQRPLREFDLGAAQFSTTCLGCSHERLRTEDHRARTKRTAQIAALEKRRRELIAALVKIDAEIACLRPRPVPPRVVLDDGGEVDDSAFGDDDLGADLRDRTAQIVALEKHRRKLIAALVKIDAEIADLRARPVRPRIVLDDGGEINDSAFGDDDLGADLRDRTRDGMS